MKRPIKWRTAATLAAAVLPAPAALANSVMEPGETTGLAAYAPLPEGGYFLNLGNWGVRSTNPNTGLGVDIPALMWSTPVTILGGRLEFLLAWPVVDISVDHRDSIYGWYYPFAQPILAWDLGGGFSVGTGVGAYMPICTNVTKNIVGCAAHLRVNLGVNYINNGWTLAATGAYGIPLTTDHTNNPAGDHEWVNLDLTAYKSIGKWQLGIVGFGSLDTTHGDVPGYKEQGQFAVGPLVGYDFGPVLLQAKLTRDVTQQNEGGWDTRFWTNLVIPLWGPSPPPPPAPAPTAVAAPAPEPARTYLVFFDWDRADLTPRAREIIAQAADASRHVQTTRIEVNGYTDLSGTAAYNLKLSWRRARSVQAELVRDGVPENEISIHGYGEANPLVPTAKGVREPQNRRVEIILH